MYKWMIILVAVAVIFTGCSGESNEEIIEPTVPVKTMSVTREPVVEKFFSIGEINAEDLFDVMSGGMGEVQQINFQTGDYVKKEEVLFSLNTEDFESNLSLTESQLRTQRDNLYTQLLDLRELFKSQTALYEIGAISKSEYDTTRSNLNQLNQRYLDARNAYDNQVNLREQDLEDRFIKSPIDGIVAAVFISESQTVNNTLAMQIISSENRVATTKVTSAQLDRLKKGMETIIYPEGNLNVRIPGSITSINNIPSSNAGLYEVTIALEENDTRTWPGEYAEIEIIVDRRESLVVPKRAVLSRDEDPHVFVVAGEYAQKIAVVPGITNGDNLEILSGLKQDDQVVILGQTFLKDGNKIAISEQE